MSDIADYLNRLSEDFRKRFYKCSTQEEIDWDAKHGVGSWRMLKETYESLTGKKFSVKGAADDFRRKKGND